VKNCALCVFLLCSLPAFATINQQQSPISQWNSGASSSCSKQFGSTSNSGDLFVVWTFWSTGSSQNQLTASVTDSSGFGKSFPSAVGPTLQVASNTYAQIFYAKSINAVPLQKDTLTVSYFLNGVLSNATTSGCVFVEYQGADLNNPLDSVSEAVSTSGNPTSTLDSGTAAPANADLLAFGAGTIDAGGAIAGSGFTAIQSHLGSITEQNIIAGNNALQRATAGLTSGGPGNWVMQMAVFRAATWTIAQGSSSTRFHGVLDASQFPGSDVGAQIMAAIAALPSVNGAQAGTVSLSGFSGTTPTQSSTVTITSPLVHVEGPGGWPTFAVLAKVVTHAACVRILIFASRH
jgi:hypothetical protein